MGRENEQHLVLRHGAKSVVGKARPVPARHLQRVCTAVREPQSQSIALIFEEADIKGRVMRHKGIPADKRQECRKDLFNSRRRSDHVICNMREPDNFCRGRTRKQITVLQETGCMECIHA